MIAQVENLVMRINNLPVDMQKNLVHYWTDDIDNEINFDKKIFDTSDKLQILAADALNEFKSGKTFEKGFDEL